MSAKTHIITRLFQSYCLPYSLIYVTLGSQVPVGKKTKRNLVYVFKPATAGYGHYIVNIIGIKYSSG